MLLLVNPALKKSSSCLIFHTGLFKGIRRLKSDASRLSYTSSESHVDVPAHELMTVSDLLEACTLPVSTTGVK